MLTGRVLLRFTHILNKTPILLIVFATLINFAIVASDFSVPKRVDPESQQESPAKGENPEHDKSDNTSFWPFAFSHISDFSTVFIAIFNGLLVYVTYSLVISTNKLWLSASEQSADLKKSIAESTRAADAMENVAAGIGLTVEVNKTVIENQRDFWARQMRAYISIDVGIYIRQNKRLRFEFRPNIANNGVTPANKVSVHSRCEIVSNRIPAGFDYSDGFPDQPSALKYSATLSPRQTKFSAHVFNRRATINEMRSLLTGRSAFHLWGKITYVDIFDVQRFTNFSYLIYMPINKRGVPTWNTTEQHNDAN